MFTQVHFNSHVPVYISQHLLLLILIVLFSFACMGSTLFSKIPIRAQGFTPGLDFCFMFFPIGRSFVEIRPGAWRRLELQSSAEAEVRWTRS